jgi:hypothetical protein
VSPPPLPSTEVGQDEAEDEEEKKDLHVLTFVWNSDKLGRCTPTSAEELSGVAESCTLSPSSSLSYTGGHGACLGYQGFPRTTEHCVARLASP